MESVAGDSIVIIALNKQAGLQSRIPLGKGIFCFLRDTRLLRQPSRIALVGNERLGEIILRRTGFKKSRYINSTSSGSSSNMAYSCLRIAI